MFKKMYMNKLEKGLVSVVVPCYNCGGKIHRLFDSLLNQTYNYLQIIVVNDGSTDNSEEVILEYEKKFQNQGLTFVYLKQANAGLGSAINTGIKHVNGEFLIWPDADDWLEPSSIEERRQFLEDHIDYGFVRSDAYIVLESDLKSPVDYMTFKKNNRFKEENLVDDYLWERDIIFCPGCHMIRTECFFKVNPKMDIYPGRFGQNYQLLLPMLCFYKFGYIDKPLYDYVIYKQSLSKGDDSLAKILLRYQGLEDILVETFKRIPIAEHAKEHYIYQVHQKYAILRAIAAYNFGNKEVFKKYFSVISKEYCTPYLLKASRNVERKYGVFFHKVYFRIFTELKNSSIKYAYKRYKFKKMSKIYNDRS